MRGRYYLIGGRQYGGMFPGSRELSSRFPAEYARLGFSGKLPELLSFRLFGKEVLPELDVYERELFLISERFQRVLSLYEPRMVSKRLLLLKEEEKREYCIPILKEIPCLSEKSSRRFGGELEKGILIREKIPPRFGACLRREGPIRAWEMRIGREPRDKKGRAHRNQRKPGHRIAALFGVRMPGDNSCGRRVTGEKKAPERGGIRSGGRV